jgi:hypothetical protein
MKYVKLFEDWIDSVEDDPELMELEQEEYDEYYDVDMEDDEDMEDDVDMEDEEYPDDEWDSNWSDSFPHRFASKPPLK